MHGRRRVHRGDQLHCAGLVVALGAPGRRQRVRRLGQRAQRHGVPDGRGLRRGLRHGGRVRLRHGRRHDGKRRVNHDAARRRPDQVAPHLPLGRDRGEVRDDQVHRRRVLL